MFYDLLPPDHLIAVRLTKAQWETIARALTLAHFTSKLENDAATEEAVAVVGYAIGHQVETYATARAREKAAQ